MGRNEYIKSQLQILVNIFLYDSDNSITSLKFIKVKSIKIDLNEIKFLKNLLLKTNRYYEDKYHYYKKCFIYFGI